jgi:hypothetical protein
MPQWATDAIELAVGLGCSAAGALSWRSGMRLLGGSLTVAGIAAIAHAVVSLAG